MISAELLRSETGAMAARGVLAWLLTYGVHGAIAGGVAELLVRVVHPSPADEHRLWKMALLLPWSTAWLVALVGGRVWGGTLLPSVPIVLRIQTSSAVAAAIGPPSGERAVLAAALIVTVGVVVGTAGFAIRFVRLRRRLVDRRPPADPRLIGSLARISARFRVGSIELTESAHLASPSAIAARAICFPAGCIASLTDGEIDAVLAHELAHLERRDPLWFFLAALVRAALWMQPFNYRVTARLRRSAEMACDERAVAATGDALSLARALGRLAHATFDPHAPLPGAAQGSNVLVERVRRLAATTPTAAPSRARAIRFGAAVAILALVGIGSANLTVAFSGTSKPSAVHIATEPLAAVGSDMFDVAAVSRRAADLVAEENRFQAEIDAMRVSPAGAPTDVAASRLLELAQDLRHAREERAWLERSVRNPIARR